LTEAEPYQVQALGVNFQSRVEGIDTALALDNDLLLQTYRCLQRGRREF
jgi:hypothetical protein